MKSGKPYQVEDHTDGSAEGDDNFVCFIIDGHAFFAPNRRVFAGDGLLPAARLVGKWVEGRESMGGITKKFVLFP